MWVLDSRRSYHIVIMGRIPCYINLDKMRVWSRVICKYRYEFQKYCMTLQWHDIYLQFCHTYHHNDIEHVSFTQCTVLCWRHIPLSEPMLISCHLVPLEQTSVKYDSKYDPLDTRKCNWKCRLQMAAILSRIWYGKCEINSVSINIPL